MPKRTAKHGDSPAPYTKYRKSPHRYPSRSELDRKYPADYSRTSGNGFVHPAQRSRAKSKRIV